MPDQGDIGLIPIPFTDLSSAKRRPVIVISNAAYNRQTTDMVVVAMTSSPAPSPYTFTITSNDLDRGALNRPRPGAGGQNLYTRSSVELENVRPCKAYRD